MSGVGKGKLDLKCSVYVIIFNNRMNLFNYMFDSFFMLIYL